VVAVSTDAANTGTEATDTDDGTSLDDRDLQTYLEGGTLVVAVVFGLVAAVGFYTSAGRAIDVWVAAQYQPVFDAGFNLVVLLVMLAVVSRLLSRLE